MNKKKLCAIFSICIFIFFSCAGQGKTIFFPAPEKNISENDAIIKIADIVESSGMGREPRLPNWLSAFLNGGIEEAEKLETYAGRYLFIAGNEGVNFSALNKWAGDFSAEYDFPMLAAARIEKRMNASNTMYPDDEYGIFYETLVKNAYSGEYKGTVKEDACWIKVRVSQDNGGTENAALPEIFIFYVLASIDAQDMQAAVNDLFSQSIALTAPAGTRAAAINRLRQNFFEGF